MKLSSPFRSSTAHLTSSSEPISWSRADSASSSTVRRSRLRLRSIGSPSSARRVNGNRNMIQDVATWRTASVQGDQQDQVDRSERGELAAADQPRENHDEGEDGDRAEDEIHYG